MELSVAEKLAIIRDAMVEDSDAERNKVIVELGHYYGNPSCDPYNYGMRRTAEAFFPVWDSDKSFAMFDKCCEMFFLDEEQKRIVRECLERHGFKEKV
jgi:hypothetical protein